MCMKLKDTIVGKKVYSKFKEDNLSNEKYVNYAMYCLCVVYILHGDSADDIEILPHGKESNSISHRPYIRTDATVLKRQEDLLQK